MSGAVPPLGATLRHRVAADDCVDRGGIEVFATPSVVRLVELVAEKALHAELAAGQSSVGTRVDIVHERPTLLGREVTATAELVEQDRRRRTYRVVVRDEAQQLAIADHERFIIDEAEFLDRLSTLSAGTEPGANTR